MKNQDPPPGKIMLELVPDKELHREQLTMARYQEKIISKFSLVPAMITIIVLFFTSGSDLKLPFLIKPRNIGNGSFPKSLD